MSAFITILTTEPKKEVRFTDKNQFDRMREARRHGDALMPVMNYCIRREDRFHALDCHWHSEMELFRVMQGTLTVQCGTDLFEAHAGDIVFFNSGELHAAVPVEAGEELYFEAIVFSPDLLCSTANDIIRVKYIQPVLDGELTVPRLIRAGTNLHESVSAAFQTAYWCKTACRRASALLSAPQRTASRLPLRLYRKITGLPSPYSSLRTPPA